MLKYLRLCLLYVLFILFGTSAQAGKIDRAYEALSVYNYFKAKRLFEKKWDKHKAAASYGLSLIYGRNDNPFYNLDSAHLYITLAGTNYSELELKKRQKVLKYGLDSLSIEKWRDTIDHKSFQRTVRKNSIEGFENYMLAHFDSEFRQQAEDLRDSLVYESIKQTNTSNSFNVFIQAYPNSYLIQRAKTQYEDLLFKELVKKDNLLAYQNFVKKYPYHPKIKSVQDSVYFKYLNAKSIDEYRRFITQNPNNQNVEQAWRSIYKLYTAKYSPEVIQKFQKEFPGYPFTAELKQDFDLANEVFLPFKKAGFWGFMNQKGDIKIPAKYDFVEPFSEGLAIASSEGKVGFINKLGDVVVPFEFEEALSFKNGLAIVSKNQYFGIINRVNKLVAPFQYDFIESYHSNIALAAKETGYGFLNNIGKELTSFDFSYAADFSNGYSIITQGDRVALLDTNLQVVIPFVYAKLSFLHDSLLVAKNDSLSGLVNLKGDTVLKFEYNRIDEMHDGLALLQKGKKYGYLNEKGQLSIPIIYEYNLSAPIWGKFEEGYAKFQRKGKFGVIDKKGKEVSPAIFENLKNYNTNALFPVKKSEKWGFSNEELQLKIKYIYKSAEPFRANSAIVKNDTAFGVIDQDANWLIQPKYKSITRIFDTLFVVQRDRVGVLNGEGEVVLPEEFIAVKQSDDRTLQLIKEDDVYYFLVPEKQLILPKQ